MSGAILPLPQYAFMAWCSVKVQGQLYSTLLLYKYHMIKTHDLKTSSFLNCSICNPNLQCNQTDLSYTRGTIYIGLTTD
jgi:hypothetical protein